MVREATGMISTLTSSQKLITSQSQMSPALGANVTEPNPRRQQTLSPELLGHLPRIQKTLGILCTCVLKQDGNHEPGCSHVILRWKGHNQITVHLSAFPVCAAMTNTSLQHSSTKLVYNSSLQHSSPQHSFTTLLYKLHHNTSHGSDIPDDTS